jgi:hypothetical protein
MHAARQPLPDMEMRARSKRDMVIPLLLMMMMMMMMIPLLPHRTPCLL